MGGYAMAGLLKGKGAIVTGGSKGIGYSVAERFTKEGAKVVISSRNKEELEVSAKKLNCDYFALDVSDSKSIESMKEWLIDTHGALDILVNCASQEYFGAIDTSELKLKVITPIFKENKSGKTKIISFYAKKARGMMARFIIQNRAKNLEDLFKFNTADYNYLPEESNTEQIVFLRDHPI